MHATFVRLTTEDQLILQGLLYVPETPSHKAYLHIHGMGGNFYENRFLDVMADGLTHEGYAFFSINTRGHDTIADIPLAGLQEAYRRVGNTFETFEECLFDIRAAIDDLARQGYTDITLCGHSLGAVKVAYYLAKTLDARINRLVLMSPADMIGLAEADEAFSTLTSAAHAMLASGKGEELLPGMLWGSYYLSAKTFLNLSTRGYPVDIFSVYDEQKSSLLANIRVPTLVFLGEHDDAVTTSSPHALACLKQKAGSAASFETTVIDGANHGYFGKEKEMTETILEWLSRQR